MEILILSRNAGLYSTQSLIRACHLRGHKPWVVDHQMCDITVEKNNFKLYVNGLPFDSLDGVIPRIGATATDYGAAILKQLECMGIPTLTKSASLLTARDKLRCLQTLAAEGIGVPKTLMVNFIEPDVELIKEILQEPLIIKLTESTHGIGVILSPDYKNAESILETLYKLREKVILQKFIAEANGADVRAFVVGGKVVASMKRQSKPGEFRSNIHRGAEGKPEPLTPEEMEIALKAVKIVDLEVAGVDIIRTDEGPMIMEVNASPGLEGIEGVTGVDVAGEIVAHLEYLIRNK